MRIFVFRHGNTFHSGEPAVWIGANEDLPLTPEGRAQGERAGRWLKQLGIEPARILAAPLKRTRHFAELLVRELPGALNVQVDPRLSELRYGTWAGKTTEEVRAMVGESVVASWNAEGRWPPEGSGWESEYARSFAETHEVVRDIAFGDPSSDVVVVSSSGRIRLMLTVCARWANGESLVKGCKIGTGHLALFEFTGGELRERSWDLVPGDEADRSGAG